VVTNTFSNQSVRQSIKQLINMWLAYSWWHVACLLMVACGWQVLELFKAADKYDVPGLVKECVQIFRKITRSADVAPLLQVTCYSRLLLLFPLQDDSKWVHAQLCSCVSGIDFGTLHQQSCSDCSLWQSSKQVLLVGVKIALMYSVWQIGSLCNLMKQCLALIPYFWSAHVAAASCPLNTGFV